MGGVARADRIGQPGGVERTHAGQSQRQGAQSGIAFLRYPREELWAVNLHVMQEGWLLFYGQHIKGHPSTMPQQRPSKKRRRPSKKSPRKKSPRKKSPRRTRLFRAAGASKQAKMDDDSNEAYMPADVMSIIERFTFVCQEKIMIPKL